jgi:hypothetical protein
MGPDVRTVVTVPEAAFGDISGRDALRSVHEEDRRLQSVTTAIDGRARERCVTRLLR